MNTCAICSKRVPNRFTRSHIAYHMRTITGFESRMIHPSEESFARKVIRIFGGNVLRKMYAELQDWKEASGLRA